MSVATPVRMDALRSRGVLRDYFGPGCEPIEHWPPERVRAYQTEAFSELLEHVVANSPFYRRKFEAAGIAPADFRTLEDLSRFPFTTKDELRGDPWILLSVPRHEVALAHTSTGTTGGAWSYILYSRDDMYVRDIAPFLHVLMPVSSSDVVINALPYEMSSSGQSFQRSLQEAAGAMVVPVGKGGFYSEPYKTVQIMADLEATVLITTPPYAMLLWEIAREKGMLPGKDLKLRFMWLTGEGCSPAYRRRLEEQWGCPGPIFYGSMECGSIGIECAEGTGLHVCEGHVILEIVDPVTGHPLPAGEMGEVVCTVLQRRASPLIRYRTQDLGFRSDAPCACGVRLPKLQIRGRIADQVAPAEDKAPAVSPYQIEQALYSQPEMGNNYQIYTSPSGLLIEAEGGSDEARARILESLARQGIAAELRWVEHVPRTFGKTRRIRPLSDRDRVMQTPSLLRRGEP